VDRSEITAELASRLVAAQFPQWADLPVVPAGHNGWDNATFRLGERLSVRLPNGAGYAEQVEKEHRWLPALARHLPLPIPQPIALGHPANGYPWPWSIYRWIEGQPANLAAIADMPRFAGDLAAFLSELYALDATGGPPPGRHSASRGGPLSVWDEQTRKSIDLLAGTINATAAIELWEEALATKWELPPVWIHGDVIGSNLLVTNGELSAVIDFGCSAVGDPACDLAVNWMFFEGTSSDAFRRGLPLDEATWTRGRGWALWKALITLAAEKQQPGHAEAAAYRMGWRQTPARVIDLALADHRRTAGL
jgi:aminoglycoside phosphotransferase (APT) family kinase protein